jgi:hypothetical protein
VLGALGKREYEAGNPTLDCEELPVVRRQVTKIVAYSLALALVVTTVAYLI